MRSNMIRNTFFKTFWMNNGSPDGAPNPLFYGYKWVAPTGHNARFEIQRPRYQWYKRYKWVATTGHKNEQPPKLQLISRRDNPFVEEMNRLFLPHRGYPSNQCIDHRNKRGEKIKIGGTYISRFISQFSR